MKKLLAVSAIAALGLNSVVLAGGLPEEMPMAPAAISTSDTGVYVGIEGGWGLTNWKLQYDDASKDNGGVGRAFLGFDLNRYFAIEAGYTYFFNKPESTAAFGGKFVKRTQDIDLMFKGKLPVVDNFDLFAKLGGNYLMTSSDVSTFESRNNFNVAYGAGADYYITPNVIASVEWLRFNGFEKTYDNKYQPHTDAFMIGLRYKFDI
jgi:opacity protein-like surface antigen